MPGGTIWPEKDVRRLLALYKSGVMTKDICVAFEGRSYDAVKNQLTRLRKSGIIESREYRSGQRLYTANHQIGVEPCVDCYLRGLCKINVMACNDFWYYVNTDKAIKDDRKPSKKIYQQIFRKTDWREGKESDEVSGDCAVCG